MKCFFSVEAEQITVLVSLPCAAMINKKKLHHIATQTDRRV